MPQARIEDSVLVKLVEGNEMKQIAAAVLPLATSYAVSEVLGFPKGVNLDFRRARSFFGLQRVAE